ncbi:hypothetical protein C478_04639 [Natrinema thermotolerans DSM 11552]|nr:hypothetical protein C478_04639 [Natrinema thermotolerans DSM 11552]
MHRRALLGHTASTAGIVGLAGCALPSTNTGPERSDRATLERIVLETETGQAEQMALTLVYAPRDDSTSRPVWGEYTVPASGKALTVSDFDGAPGVYSLTARSVTHDTVAVVSFNSYGDAVGSGPHQFEVVITGSGDVWTNLNEAGEPVSVPGQ